MLSQPRVLTSDWAKPTARSAIANGFVNFTPAMKMGLVSTQLPWRDLILAPIPENAHEFSSSTVLYGLPNSRLN